MDGQIDRRPRAIVSSQDGRRTPLSESRGEIPKKIDRYEIIEAVGYGAMGAVYRAFDPLIKRPVAVKTLRLDVPPQSPDYKAFLDRFATEARTAGRPSHPNIITLYDVGHTEDQVPWLAMEFVEGQTVAELLEGERLRSEVVVSLVSADRSRDRLRAHRGCHSSRHQSRRM